MKYLGNVIEHFSVPHPAPEPVEKASAQFEQFSSDFQAARAKYHKLVSSRLDDIRAANADAAAARIKGTKSTAPTEAKIDADIARAKDDMGVLAEATDQAGDALMAAVAEHRDEWIAVLDAADAEATERVAGLIEATRQATDDLHMARGAADWLRRFRVAADTTQYPGASGHTASDFAALEMLVTGETTLVGYRDGQPIWETRKVVKS